MELKDTIEIMEQSLMDGVVDDAGNSVAAPLSPADLARILKVRRFYCLLFLLSSTVSLVISSFALRQLKDLNEECDDYSSLFNIFLIWSLVQSVVFWIFHFIYLCMLISINFDPRHMNRTTRDIFDEHSCMFRYSEFIAGKGLLSQLVLFCLSWVVYARLKSCVDEFNESLLRKIIAISVFGSMDVYLNLFVLALAPCCCCLFCLLFVNLYRQYLKKQPVGMEEKDLRRIKSERFEKQANVESPEVCSVCLNEFENGEDVRVLPCTGKHTFHRDCIDVWLKKNDTCPQCRSHLISKVQHQRNSGL